MREIFGLTPARGPGAPAIRGVANVKGDKVLPKGAAASMVVRHVGPQAPIVMGRSVSLHHKSKLDHVKMKPPDSNENLTSADGSQ